MQGFAELAEQQPFLAFELRRQRCERTARSLTSWHHHSIDGRGWHRLGGRIVLILNLAGNFGKTAGTGIFKTECQVLDQTAVDALVGHRDRIGLRRREACAQRQPAGEAEVDIAFKSLRWNWQRQQDRNKGKNGR